MHRPRRQGKGLGWCRHRALRVDAAVDRWGDATWSRVANTFPMLASLRKSARLPSTHYSTQIEGNKLTPSQVEDVLSGGGRFPGRERDETEVRNYYRALEFAVAEGPKVNRLTGEVVR